jgi:uncharacterized membrane protein YczE
MNRSFGLRLIKLIAGLYVFGWGVALMVHAGIGVGPWDVFAQGLSKTFGISFGWATLVVSFIVLACWIPLKQKLGIGTVLNAILIGLFADTVFPLLPTLTNYWLQLGEFILGMVVMAFATGLYISANLGSGPRDGLMIGTARATGWKLWMVRTGYEFIVMAIGFFLGGQVREGTLIFALFIGYLMQTSLRLWGVSSHKK